MTIRETPVPGKRGKRSIFDRVINDNDMAVLVDNPGKFFEVDNQDRPDKKWTRGEWLAFREAARTRGFAVRSVGCTNPDSLGRVWVAYDARNTQAK